MFETVGNRPFEIPEMGPTVDGRSYSMLKSDDKSHEAGYDAFLTGICFIALANRLGSLQNPPVDIVLPDSPLLHPFLNKLPVGRLKDLPYINVAGDDPKPKREHVFHLTFPREWKFNDISRLFSPFGGIQVSWLSDTTAYVGLNRKEQAAAVTKNLKNKTNDVYVVKSYREYQASLDAENNKSKGKRKITDVTEGSSERDEDPRGSKNGSDEKKEIASVVRDNKVEEEEEDGGWEVATGSSDPSVEIKKERKRKKKKWAVVKAGVGVEDYYYYYVDCSAR